MSLQKVGGPQVLRVWNLLTETLLTVGKGHTCTSGGGSRDWTLNGKRLHIVYPHVFHSIKKHIYLLYSFVVVAAVILFIYLLRKKTEIG